MPPIKRENEHDLRPEFDCIVQTVERGSRVLDLGCGDGRLLARLTEEKEVSGRGIEKSEEFVTKCIGKRLSVHHGDIEDVITNYPDGIFDYVILNKTLQVTHNPRAVIKEMLRVGKSAIVSLPNFAHWKIRLELLLTGRMPKSPALPFEWYDTPNIHLTTIKDFKGLCRREGMAITREIYINNQSPPIPEALVAALPNLLAEIGVFVLNKR